MHQTQLDILYEDNHLLVVNKPAGIATMGAERGDTVHSLAAAYLKSKYHKPGNVYVGVVSRLDMMTSGVMVLARTSKAASRLVPQFGAAAHDSKQSIAAGAVKIYLAAVAGQLDSGQAELTDFVRKDDAAHRMRTVEPSAPGAQRAELEYLKLAHADDATIVAVRLNTGRKHQIRVQFSERRHPLIGDRKYGSPQRFPAGIALHSWCLQLTHPTQQTRCTWYADLPSAWQRYQELVPARAELIALVEKAFQVQIDGAQDA